MTAAIPCSVCSTLQLELQRIRNVRRLPVDRQCVDVRVRGWTIRKTK